MYRVHDSALKFEDCYGAVWSCCLVASYLSSHVDAKQIVLTIEDPGVTVAEELIRCWFSMRLSSYSSLGVHFYFCSGY